MIVHHVSKSPLDAASLVAGGSRGKGPASMGLWTCAEPAAWQKAYGAVLNRLVIDDAARTLRTTSADLCDRAGSPSSEDWRALGERLLKDGHQAVLLCDPATGEPCETIVLDPAIVLSSEVVDWDQIPD